MYGNSLQTVISLKNHVGDICGGTVDWLTGRELQVRVDGHLEPGATCEMRVELRGVPVSIYIHGEVVKVLTDGTHTEASCAIIRIDQMPNTDRERLQRWLAEGVTGGTSADPASWVEELSEAHSGFGRASIREGLRKGLGLDLDDKDESDSES